MQKIPRLEADGPDLRLYAATDHLDSLHLVCDDGL